MAVGDPWNFIKKDKQEYFMMEQMEIEWPEQQLDYSDSFTIKVTKVNFDREFTHWEGMIHSSDGELHCEVTAPTMGGVLDELLDYLYDRRYEWTKDDANKH